MLDELYGAGLSFISYLKSLASSVVWENAVVWCLVDEETIA